jgi:hypothetical protein
MPYNVKVGGTWRTTSANYVKVSGTWRTVSSMWIKVSGTWRQFYTSVIVRAFTGLSNNYPDNKGAVGFEVSGNTGIRFGGEGGGFSNLCYSADLVNSPSTWTGKTAYPQATQGPFGDKIGSTIWGIAGYPATSSAYGTSNLATSWTTGASPSGAYWHASTYAAGLSAILKVGGFNSTVESFNGSSWTNRGGTPSGMGFGELVDLNSRTYYFGGPGNESNSTACYSYNGSSWTTETSQPVATRRTYGTNLDDKIIELGGEAISSAYRYSGTGGSWSVVTSGSPGSSYTTSTISGVAAYGSAGTYTWKYA